MLSIYPIIHIYPLGIPVLNHCCHQRPGSQAWSLMRSTTGSCCFFLFFFFFMGLECDTIYLKYVYIYIYPGIVYSLHPQQSIRHNYKILQTSFLLYLYIYMHMLIFTKTYIYICVLISVMIGKYPTSKTTIL